MDAVEMEGEPISPEEFTKEAGWMESHRRMRNRDLVQLGLTSAAAASQHDAEGHDAGKERRRDGRSRAPPQGSRRAWRAPELPKEDVKIILRPRNGLELRRCSQAVLKDGVRCAANINTEDAEEDTLRINPLRNVLVISTPSLNRAALYGKIDKIMIGDQAHGINAYTTPPEGSAKGIIHNIPCTDSDEDIMRSLVNRRNPTILQARRLGTSNTAIIAFEGEQVPYYVYYRGAEYRCYLHKKKHEVCDRSGVYGHRADVCPRAADATPKICPTCGLKDPPGEHPCEPRCAICGLDHKTGDKKCLRRYRTPHLLQKRRWEKERKRQLQSRRSRSKERSSKSTLVAPRDPSESSSRLPLHDVADDNGGATKGGHRSRSNQCTGERGGAASRTPSQHRMFEPFRRQSRHRSQSAGRGAGSVNKGL
ncbi:unnamed protein product, partial [Ixodes pacificus]